MQARYNLHTMPDGLRVIHLPSASPVVYCGYAVNAGTRDEQEGEEGIAHFCEHMTFKGTSTRKPGNILRSIESVGGDLNAFTTKEDTVFHAAILKGDIRRAVDLLTDIVFHSTYPQNEIEKEVHVICEEIESYNDSPSELIYDKFEDILFSGHPLGHNILGNPEQLRSYTTNDALRFTRRHYRADNSVFFAYGDIDFLQLIKTLARCGHGNSAETAEPPLCRNNHRTGALQPLKATVETLRMDTHQAHVMMGSRSYGHGSEQHTALYLLNNILGGPAMTARLNLILREQKALVYTVESNMTTYSDIGAWSVYFGCDPENVQRCVKYVRRELDKLMSKPLSKAQTDAAKKQIKGQIGIANDNRENFAIGFARAFLHYGETKDIARLMRRIDAVTPEMMQSVAQDIFSADKLCTLIIR